MTLPATSTDLPVAGDWTGQGHDSPGFFRGGSFYLTNQVCNCAAAVNYTTSLGQSGDLPTAGDWTGSGRTGIGIFRSGLFQLKNDPTTSGAADFNFAFGISDDKPIAGHWTGGTGSLPSPRHTPPPAAPTPTMIPGGPVPTVKLAPTFIPSRK